MRTLLVEDDDELRRLLEVVLEGRGHDVIACASGEEALARIVDDVPAMVLLDWMLPGIDGLQMCQRLRSLGGGHDAIIMIVTVRDRPTDLATVLRSGADDYVRRPIDVGHLNVRLEIAEQRVRDRQRRRAADERLAAALADAIAMRSDLLAILDRLPIGAVLVDGRREVVFISRAARLALRLDTADAPRGSLERAFGLDETQRRSLMSLLDTPAAERRPTELMLEFGDGDTTWLRIDAADDPRASSGWILMLEDISETETLRRQLHKRAVYGTMIGRSDAMQSVFRLVRDLSTVDTTVLIEGETGTGKELVARALHAVSERRARPFVAVNLAGLAESLVASQLFGHKRGAFTGAIADHKGVFEAAHGGTLFLNEVGDIPPAGAEEPAARAAGARGHARGRHRAAQGRRPPRCRDPPRPGE
jgi:DNA-binding NtrC family response regulator